ncbi:farnesyl-diphosphate synthase [Anaerobacillus arseniciselenatis]|uniref:Farnesyl diphosphate synthase n=1 Tax=Anaerobacillus arseniciselenatis TaxID=85682 RepID=A0A1S2LUK2_9BACI|nr:farnesyl diphosphate synthase [Anaerobacillus arseniciselenatis]OIJ16026.1 farnesyl-diphosphate synthase [Anaerobacillus arseniciselenatis]
MNSLTLEVFLEERKAQIETKLPEYVTTLNAPSILKEAMLYSLQAGGKRLRPMLLFATVEGFGGNYQHSLPVASAIEMIHTYSLIHDDLPAMDNDDFRRGKLTNHKVFGDATAILAGDALLTYAFEVIVKMDEAMIDPHQKLRLVAELTRASGPEGMVGGQVADMEGENKSLSLSQLEFIHHHKTGDLLSFSIIAGAIIAKASNNDVDNLRSFAKHLGLAFQIKDDILDIEGSQDTLGKPVGSDITNEKSTYPKLLGLDGAKKKLDDHISKAKEYLYNVNMDHEKLEMLADYIMNRDR